MAICLLIIGGDGDLAMRKLFPALYALERANELDGVSNIIGLARSTLDTKSWRKKIHDRVCDVDRFCDEKWQVFAQRLHYISADATTVEAYTPLKQQYLKDGDELFVYLSVASRVFGGATQALQAVGLNRPPTRIVVEKPVGESLESFNALNAQICAAFDEMQIFRIDHYLGKEAVQNLLALRFANVIFGAIWSSNFIDYVQISVAENVGIEERLSFYDATGALKDMVQNHLMQVLCLVAMEPPAANNAQMIQAEKLKVLQCLEPIELNDINTRTVRGQYVEGFIGDQRVPGYQQDLGQSSSTETYVAIKAHINNWRWANVPFYLRTGKRLARRGSEIVIQFKAPKHNIFKETPLLPNQLLIRLQPDEGMRLRILNKRPGLSSHMPLDEVDLNLSIPMSHQKHTYDAYARLLQDVLHWDRTLFVSAEEVAASWQWIDQITEHWDYAKAKAHPYAAGSMGPSQAVVMLARDGCQWEDWQ